jgi:type I restriction enzyme S subunit
MAKKKSVDETVETTTQIDAPYELPEGWKWVRLGDVTKFERGITFPASAKENEKTESNIPCLRTANVQENIELNDLIYVNKTFMKSNPEKIVKKNDIIFSSANSRELVGKSSFINEIPFEMTFGGFILCIRTTNEDSKFLFYFLRLHFLLGRFMGKSTQTTNIANINTESLSNVILPLPPLVEQQRIVNRIESMFAKLDEAKEKAQNVVDSFETRKAAILHQAFTGNLTAKWRKENGISDDSWEEKTIGECGIWERGRSKHRPRNAPELFGGKYPFIQTGDIANADVYILEHKQTLSEIGLAQSRLFKKGTVCITIAANIGKAAILSYDCCFPDSVVGFSPFDNIDSKFMYFEITNLQKELDSMAPATAQKNLNLKLLTSVKLFVPSLPEQQEIVRILDAILKKERTAKSTAEQVLGQIDLLKKSILTRAFRGEL